MSCPLTARPAFRRFAATLLAGASMALAACTSSPPPSDEPTPSAAPSDPASAGPEATPIPEPVVDLSMCEPGEGKTVTLLDDVVIPAQVIPAIPDETVTVDGQEITLPGAPAVTIPERVGEAGCTVVYDAPGGCLGAVEISPAYIPPYTIPERRLPAVTGPDGSVMEELVLPAVTIEGQYVEGQRQEEVCQVTSDEAGGDYVSAVVRPAVYRTHLRQPSHYQMMVFRPIPFLGGSALDTMMIDDVWVDSMFLPSASIEYGYLKGYLLEGTEDVEVSRDEDATTYTTSGDVLFDFDQATIKDEAIPDLEAILADIHQRPAAAITVEGHTDDQGDAAYNLDLSLRRAEAVAAWLTGHGVSGPELIVRGLGEDYPRAPNDTPEGQALNRRVVITVTA
jgi:outer membrane protein OmpA-like peptidoglycan-associated protein